MISTKVYFANNANPANNTLEAVCYTYKQQGYQAYINLEKSAIFRRLIAIFATKFNRRKNI